MLHLTLAIDGQHATSGQPVNIRVEVNRDDSHWPESSSA